MKTSQLLKEEISAGIKGTYAPHYFKYLGYREDFSASKVTARANATEKLFSLPHAFLYKNDWIAGSLRPLWCEKNKEELDYALFVEQNYGERNFTTNFDHFSPNYRSFVKGGIPGLLERIEDSAKAHAEAERLEYLSAMKKTVLGMRQMILGYAEEAVACMGREGYSEEKLRFIRENCLHIADAAPKSFAEALQLIWFSHICFNFEGRYAMALGRIDQYLYPYYRNDIDNGIITREFAVELLENIFMKIYEWRALKGWDDVVNICIGGTAPDGSCEVNELSYCVLHAVRNCRIPGPNLSARIGEGCPDEFLDECLKVIGTGIGYPALMNDRVNIAALLKYGYEKEDVYDYTMVGCIENFITGMQPPWTDGRFDTPRFFEFLLNRGKGIYTKSFGVDTGDLSEITSMAQFMQKFEEQLRYGAAEYYACFTNENTRVNPKEYVQPFLSCFCEDCIGRARDICDGGSKYPSVHGAVLMGVGTVCDSLAAIEKVVFEDHAATLEDIRDAIMHNYEGYEELHKKLLAAPKYGNNDPFVDKYAVWFVDFLSEQFSHYKTHDGGGMYVAMAANTANVFAGKNIAATPDGRLQGEALSDAASPTYGRDTRGATVTVTSLTKPDYTKAASGTVVNQKFSPSMFEDGKREKLLSLLKVYFRKGGQEMQINATSRETLQDAMDHPEKYRDLVVRVSGFSAFYVTLDKGVQLDILNRTQQR